VTFFPIPDEFYRDPKYLGWTANEYVLWMLAGSWSADRLTDGSVPTSALALFPEYAREAAALLVERGVWRRARGGGYQYVEWPRECSRSLVEGRRQQYRRSKRGQREIEEPAGQKVSSPRGLDVDSTRTPRGHVVESTRSSKPVTHTTKESLRDSLLDGFDDFWQAYPRKAAKPDARKAWTKATKAHDPTAIMAGVKRYAEERRGQDQKFTAYPATWLNRESWNDEPAQPILAAVNGHAPYRDPDPSTYHEGF
jgi:hypothetical protein